MNDPYQPPSSVTPGMPYGQPPGNEPDATGGLIPYRNPHALIAYYLGLFSLLPCVGLLLAIPALILGIMGLRARKRNPVIKGSVHAWIGIVMGSLMTLLWGSVVILMIIGAVTSRQN